MCVYSCAHCGRQRWMLGVFFNYYPPYSLKKNHPVEPRHFDKTSLASRLASGISLLCFPSDVIRGSYQAHPGFIWALGIQTPVLMPTACASITQSSEPSVQTNTISFFQMDFIFINFSTILFIAL